MNENNDNMVGMIGTHTDTDTDTETDTDTDSR